MSNILPDEVFSVYSLLWLASGCVYIGITSGSLQQRLVQHKSRSSPPIRAQFRTNGDPVVRMIAGGLTRDQAAARESQLIMDTRLVIGPQLLNE